jgi:hypothetical protein
VIEEGDQAERTLRREPAYWLIEKIEDDPPEVLILDLRGGRRALSVFSHREEAEMYLWLGRMTDGWRARKCERGEIARVLSAPRTSIGFVVLDPLPEMLAEHTVELVSLTRERFTIRLMRPPEGTSEPRVGQRAGPITDGSYRAPLPQTAFERWARRERKPGMQTGSSERGG